MGQKVHPTGIRLGITKDHNSIWYAGKDKYADNLLADIAVRSLIEKRLEKASVSKVVIERPAQSARSEERRVGKECRSRWSRYQAEDGIRDADVTGVQTCALPISKSSSNRYPFRYY